MSGLFGGGKKANVAPVAAITPDVNSAEAAKAAEEAKRKVAMRRGSGSTILTSGLGVSDDGTIQNKKLGA